MFDAWRPRNGHSWFGRRTSADYPTVHRLPPDVTRDEAIGDLMEWGNRAIDEGHRSLTIDLSQVVAVDSSFLASLVLLSRRGRRDQVILRVVGMSSRLQSLLKIYRIEEPLRDAGVVFEARPEADRPSGGA